MVTIKPIQLSIVVSSADLEYINRKVAEGEALNRSDYIRGIIREKSIRDSRGCQ